jgi:DNA-binding transcriptional MerR regulator
VSTTTVPATYSGYTAARLVGITYRQLDYWARTDLIRPSVKDAAGSGTRRRYSYQDLLELKTVKRLLDAGIGLGVVRDVFGTLHEVLGGDAVTANLVIHGSRTVVIRTDGELVDLVNGARGVLSILPLASVKNDLDVALLDDRLVGASR